MIETAGWALKNKKVVTGIIFLLLVCIFATFSSCNAVKENNGFQTENVIRVLGKGQAEISELEDTAEFLYNGVSVKTKYEFENDKLIRIQYNFDTETDTAFRFVNEVKAVLEEKFGKSNTYETLPNRIEGLTIDEYLASDTMQYQEYWIDSGVDFTGLVPEEYKDTKRVDLGIGINKLPADEPITIVYIGGIVNSINTQKLSD